MSKILVFSIPPVNKNINNTFELLFNGIKKRHKLYFLSCRDGVNYSDVFNEIYTLSEKLALRSILKRKTDVFQKTHSSESTTELTFYKNNNHFHNIKRIVRDILWSLSAWKKSSLKTFLKNENFDYIVAPSEGYHYYLHILKYICEETNSKLILYTWDDNFTFRQRQLSPLFFLYRIVTRMLLKKIARRYTYKTLSISDKTKQEVDRFLHKDSIIIKKTVPDIKAGNPFQNNDIRIIYGGNLLNGRDKSLLKIAKSIQKDSYKAIKLDVYTDGLNRKSIKKLSKFKNVFLHDVISHKELLKEEANSSIGLMLESLSFTKRKISRLSISTKFTDYIGAELPILAIIDNDSATASEIIKNNLGYVISKQSEIEKALDTIISVYKMGKYQKSITEYKEKYASKNQDQLIEQLFL